MLLLFFGVPCCIIAVESSCCSSFLHVASTLLNLIVLDDVAVVLHVTDVVSVLVDVPVVLIVSVVLCCCV